jgi:hypothetical protein
VAGAVICTVGHPARHLTVLVALDLDRLARDPRDLEDLMDVVEASSPRIPVQSVTGPLRLDNNADVAMARVQPVAPITIWCERRRLAASRPVSHSAYNAGQLRGGRGPVHLPAQRQRRRIHYSAHVALATGDTRQRTSNHSTPGSVAIPITSVRASE